MHKRSNDERICVNIRIEANLPTLMCIYICIQKEIIDQMIFKLSRWLDLSVGTVCLLIINFWLLLYSSKVPNRSQLVCLCMQCIKRWTRSIICSLHFHERNISESNCALNRARVELIFNVHAKSSIENNLFF